MFYQSFEEGIKSRKIITIDDIDKKDGNYTESEVVARCKLASLCRLIDLYKWSQSIYNHMSVRIPSTNLLLINPFGLLLNEITASNLVTVDLNGNIIKNILSDLGVNRAGCVLHSAIHQIRHDVNCVIHVHTAPIVAVSCMKVGLLPISQEALIVGDVSYYEYNGIAIHDDPREIATALGPKNKVLILRNHGAICTGASVEEAFYWLYHLFLACHSQISAFCGENGTIIFPSKDSQERVKSIISLGYDEVIIGGEHKWGLGELEYEAHMRTLDRYGYNTGYPHKLNCSISGLRSKRPSIVSRKINMNKYNSQGLASGNLCSDESVSVAYSVDSGTHILIENEMEYDSDNLLCVASDDNIAVSPSLESIDRQSIVDPAVPRSESSREMFIRYASQSCQKTEDFQFPDADDTEEKETTSQCTSPVKNKTRHESLQRRSKSLTSGVERAIYRRINEKYRCEVK